MENARKTGEERRASDLKTRVEEWFASLRGGRGRQQRKLLACLRGVMQDIYGMLRDLSHTISYMSREGFGTAVTQSPERKPSDRKRKYRVD